MVIMMMIIIITTIIIVAILIINNSNNNNNNIIIIIIPFAPLLQPYNMRNAPHFDVVYSARFDVQQNPTADLIHCLRESTSEGYTIS